MSEGEDDKASREVTSLPGRTLREVNNSRDSALL